MATAAALATSARTLPRRQSTVLVIIIYRMSVIVKRKIEVDLIAPTPSHDGRTKSTKPTSTYSIPNTIKMSTQKVKKGRGRHGREYKNSVTQATHSSKQRSWAEGIPKRRYPTTSPCLIDLPFNTEPATKAVRESAAGKPYNLQPSRAPNGSSDCKHTTSI